MGWGHKLVGGVEGKGAEARGGGGGVLSGTVTNLSRQQPPSLIRVTNL